MAESRGLMLSRSRQDYLKALYALAPHGETVATSALAIRLAVSAPSVTSMLGQLAREKLVAYTPRGGARLTTAGSHRALEIVRRHRILEAFLEKVLGLDWSEVHEDAEVLEHHISDRVLEAMNRAAGHPAEDPHGHVIPDRRGRMHRRALTEITALAEGARATVREIADGDRARMARWKELGMVPGARVRLRQVRRFEDVFELEVNGRSVITGSEGLAGVLVERSGKEGPA
jgi:DtxR family Mn-dependent transcriptional regulator